MRINERLAVLETMVSELQKQIKGMHKLMWVALSLVLGDTLMQASPKLLAISGIL